METALFMQYSGVSNRFDAMYYLYEASSTIVMTYIYIGGSQSI